MPPETKQRPGVGTGAPQVAGKAENIVPPTGDTNSIPRRVDAVETWARPILDLVASSGTPPLAGSPEWVDLPPSDARKFAAVIRAALAWLADGTDDALHARLADEIELADLAVRYRVSAASRDVSAAFADLRPHAARYVSHEELERRRAELLEVA